MGVGGGFEEGLAWDGGRLGGVGHGQHERAATAAGTPTTPNLTTLQDSGQWNAYWPILSLSKI